MGHDFAGVVEAVGAGVTRLKAGDAVLGVARFRQAGAFAEMVMAPEKAVVLKPLDLSYERAAALPTVGVTAYQATAAVRPGQAVFVNGCLGGVGRAAVQFARARGASVAGSCRDTAADEARELGVEPVVGFGFDPAALAERFDLVFDTPGMLPLATARTLLKPRGTIVDIVPTPVKMIRSALPGPFRAMMGRPVTAEEILRPAHPAAQHDQTRVRDPDDSPDRLRDQVHLGRRTGRAVGAAGGRFEDKRRAAATEPLAPTGRTGTADHPTNR